VLAHVLLGGLAGTAARYALGGLVQARAGTAFPTGTLIVNLAGALALGFLMRYATGTTVSPELRAGLTIGFCGAFTTMSTFGYETFTLLATQDYLRAALYVALSLVGSVGAVALGTAAASRLL
jgi:CrcB protein